MVIFPHLTDYFNKKPEKFVDFFPYIIDKNEHYGIIYMISGCKPMSSLLFVFTVCTPKL